MCVSNGRAGLIVRLGPRTAHVRSQDERVHWALDREGRLLAGHQDGLHHRVGLDARVLVRAGARDVPREATPAESDEVLARAAATLRRARAELESGDAAFEVEDRAFGQLPAGAVATTLALLARAEARAERPAAERAAFARAYRPVRMVPPDCAQALVVQVTEGCRWSRCAFCTLYAGTPYRVKDVPALEAHLDAVAELLGAGAALRTRVFLGDANALLAPLPLLLAALSGARARFPQAARGGADAFVDAFSRADRTQDELGALRAAGLRRVTVGLETGHAPLLRALRKPATPEAVAALVRRARDAGLAVGVTVLAGAGGRTFAEAHVADTTRVVRGLGLGAADVVFLSPLVGAEGGGDAPLDEDELADQTARLREALADGPWRVVPYDLRRSIL